MRRRSLVAGLLFAVALAFGPTHAASPYYSIQGTITPTAVPQGFIITGALCLVPNCTPGPKTPTFSLTGMGNPRAGKGCTGVTGALMLIDWKDKTSSKGYLDILRPNQRTLLGVGIILSGARTGARVVSAMMANGDPCLVAQSVTGSVGF
jgi:hypothetical protein